MIITLFLYLMLPTLVLGGIGWLVSRSPANALGAALALPLYFAAYTAWVASQSADGLIWLGYVFSLPGAALGALVGGAIGRDYRMRSRRIQVGIGLGVTVLGIAINQASLCATLMHCAL